MAFSMHSHSGQFCPGHAVNSLDEIILQAIKIGMSTYALTEHMPRLADKDLYPEEVFPPFSLLSLPTNINQVTGGHTIAEQRPRHEAFILEAVRKREKYAGQIHILIGFEAEWIGPEYEQYAELIHELAGNEAVDFFIGSVHHVRGIPIDYDAALYQKARQSSGDSEEQLFGDYFDEQFEMLKALGHVGKDFVVGHFDLIRLLAEDKDGDLKRWPKVWSKVVRNLAEMVKQERLMEVNSAGLRKGLKEPYPGRAIVEQYVAMGGRLTLSDDSHGVAQVGTNYGKAVEYLDSLGVKEVWKIAWTKTNGLNHRVSQSVTLEEIKRNLAGEAPNLAAPFPLAS
jgi:histidinol-phosphatase (PHP family)